MGVMESVGLTVGAEHPAVILAIAALLDYAIGDPWGWPHPVRVMGWAIDRYTRAVWAWGQKPFEGWIYRWAGVGLTVTLVGGSALVAWGLIAGATRLHPLLGLGVHSVMLASCFAGRSLRAAAIEVLTPLTAGDRAAARSRLAMYVGRDTDNLSEPEILRALLESVTENATDGVTAPLFYALVGAFLPGVGSAPLAIAFKAASTLDSTVGYRRSPYTDLGWCSAKLDDLLTWLPCRATVGTIALLSGRPGHVLGLCRRDAPQDPSPNAGWSECAYAAALDVQVGGLNYYQGVAKEKPRLGEAIAPITPAVIQQALGLTRRCVLLWLAGAIAALLWPTLPL